MLSTIIAIGATALTGADQAPPHHHRSSYPGPVIQSPMWARAPSFADVAAAYPVGARGVDGDATLFCSFGATGELGACRVTDETPGGLGFGRAALSLAAKFAVSIDPAWAMNGERFGVEVPVRLTDPSAPRMRDHLISNPVWTNRLTPGAVASFFPAAAAEKGLMTGRGVAECRVDPKGALQACRGVSAEPEGEGFAEAAVKAAAGLRMSPWTKDGGPVDGATVRVPIRITADEPSPEVASDHVVWLQTPTGQDVLNVFPRLALMRNVGGQVDMRCRVLQSGGVSHCDVVDETPSGWGFGRAAQELSPKYRVSMRDRGHPEPGSWIRVSIPLETMSH